MRRALFVLVLVLTARSLDAQTCPTCPGAFSLPARLCGFPELIQTGTGCPGPELKNCQKPTLLGPRLRIISTGPSTFEAQLAVEARAPFNSDPAVLSAGKMKLYWTQGPVATQPTTELCEDGTRDRMETYLAFGGLTCAGAPYNLPDVYSLMAVVCAGGGSCQKTSQIDGMPVVVPKAMLCPEPPKWSCCIGEGCRQECINVGPGHASAAGEGASASPPISGPGAVLSYRAGGVGGTGWPGSAAWNTTLGRYWSHTYAERIVPDPGAGHVWLLTKDATFREYTDAALDGTYETVSPSDEYRDLFKVPTGWELRGLDGSIQSFDAAGLWTQTVDRNGNAKIAQYTGGVLTRVTFPDGRREDFAYHPSGKLQTITEVGIDGTTSRAWIYTWDGLDLRRIDRPDGTAWEMFYSSDPNLGGYLTRIDLLGTTPGSGRVEVAWEYDASGNVTKIWQGDPVSTGPNAVNLNTINYDSPVLATRGVVTDALNRKATYYFQRDTNSRKPRLVRFEDGCFSCGIEARTQYEYGDSANPLLPTAMIDGRNNRTEYTYNADGRMLTRTEAVGTPLARQTRWEYHPTFRSFPTLIERPSTAGAPALRKPILSYDGEGNLLTRTEEGKEAGAPFSLATVMTYNGAGQVLSINLPGNGTADQTTFSYDPTRGDLVPLSRIEPLIGATTFTHDAFNRRTGVTDVNNVETVTAYDALNRVTSVTQDGGSGADLVTTYEYTAFKDLFRTIHPEGNLVEYGYDAAGRLVTIESKPNASTSAERTFYTLDKVGHRIQEDLQSWNGSAWVTQATTRYEYPTKCYLNRIIRGTFLTEHAYDCNGNLSWTWDANHPFLPSFQPATQAYSYDALNRLTKVTQPEFSTTTTNYEYDVQDHLKKVTDAEGNVTTYTYSDRDLLTQDFSGVSGTKTYTYNEHGELVTESDARGITVTRTVDVLDRVTAVSYPDPSLNVTHTYDTPGTFAKGRLTGITRHGETISYQYDRFGRMTQDGELTYGYDRNGNRTTIGYLGNVVAIYTYDHADRQKTLSITEGGGPAATLVSNASYKPFGPLASLGLGNGLNETRTYDQRYSPASIQVAGSSTLLNWSYAVDPVGNITGITDLLNSANNRSYGYQDFFYFLTQGNGPWGTRSMTYDKIGNRLTEVRGPVTDTYNYQINSAGGRNPKLLSITPTTRLYSYDEAGNTLQILTDDSQLDMIPNGADQPAFLRSMPEEKLATLTYDGRNYLRRVQGDASTCLVPQTLATYSSEGLLHRREQRLLDGLTSTLVQSDSVLYFAGRPVATLRVTSGGSSDLTYLSTDHLGTPILATSEAGTTIWQGGFEPFGRDFSGASTAGVFLRFPGQWVDTSWSAINSGLYQNVHRWYLPGPGRYTQPDPVVAVAPRQQYLYASDRPNLLIDPDGREPKPSEGRWCSQEERDPFDLPRACPDCDIPKAGARLDAIRRISAVKCGNKAISQVISPAGATVFADVDWDRDRAWYIPQGDQCINHCLCVHETYHIRQVFGIAPTPQPATANALECDAYRIEEECLSNLLGWTFRVRLPFP